MPTPRGMVSVALRFEGALMLLPTLCALVYRERCGRWFVAVGALCCLIGLAVSRKEPADQLLANVPGSMAGNLHGVLARVTMRRPEYGDQHVVQAGNLSVMDCISIGFQNGSAL